MAATIKTIQWTVTVEDPEHWSDKHLELVESDNPFSYEDWVINKLEKIMREHGNKFIAHHPDLFRSTELS